MKDQSLGARAKGAGANEHFPWVTKVLKEWLSTERSYGHSLSKKDLLEQFLEVLREGWQLFRVRVIRSSAQIGLKSYLRVLSTESLRPTASCLRLVPGFSGLIK